MKGNQGARYAGLVLSLLLTLGMGYVTLTLAGMTMDALGDWRMNRFSVQERLYEAVDWFFVCAQMLLPAFFLLVFSLCLVIHALGKGKGPGSGEGGIRTLWPAFGFAVFFLLLFLLNRETLGKMAGTAERSEVPAALRDHVRSGWQGIGMELAALGLVLSLAAWIRRGRGMDTDEGKGMTEG